MKTRLVLALAPLALLTAVAVAQDKTGEAPPPKKTGEAPPPKKSDETPPKKPFDPSEPVTITLSTETPKVAVGQPLKFKVTVKNVSPEPVPLRPIAMTRFSLALQLSGPRWKRPGMLFTIPGGANNPKIDPMSSLKAGESITADMTLPTVRVGKLTLKGFYIAHIAPRKRGQPAPKVKPKVLYSNPLDFEVVPTEEGGTVCIARIVTAHGRIDMKFHDDHAPNTVLNFIRHAQAKKYDGTVFHRVIKDFMIQGGDPKGDGTGGPGYSIPPEFSPLLRHKPGAVAMARTRNPASAGCQFYICLGSPSHLDRQYAIFGQVIEGQEVVNKIGAVATGAQDRPTEKQTMTKVTIEVVKSVK